MNCFAFRENYSDFADGLLDGAAEIRARRHLAECIACRRFDAAFRTGVGLLRQMPTVMPSRDFGNTLRQKLRHEAVASTPALRRWSGVAGAMLIVTVVGIVTWERREGIPGGPAPVALSKRYRNPAHTWDARNSAVLQLANDTTPYPDDPFHPIPGATIAHSALYASDLSFETTAVWNEH